MSGDPRVREVFNHCADLHDLKQQDYGRKEDPFANVRAAQDWGIEPWVGALVRAGDKFKRLQQFVKTGSLANEGVLDSFDDLIVYVAIAKVLYQESRQNIIYHHRATDG